MLELLIAALVLYIAYRAIRGGFTRPQSQKLNGFGIFACIMLLILALLYAAQFFENYILDSF